MPEEYNICRMSEERIPDFIRLSGEAFGAELSREEVIARFKIPSIGKEYIGFIAIGRDSGEAAAFYGAIPTRVEFDGQQYLASQGSAAMTSEAHRGRGLFTKTASATAEMMREEGIIFSFAFPNEFSYGGFRKMGWEHNGYFNSYHIFVPTFPLGWLAHRVKPLLPVYRRWFERIVSRWTAEPYFFPNSSKEPGVGFVIRDELTDKRYGPVADRCIIRHKRSSAWINQQRGTVGIGDLDLEDEKDFHSMMRILKFICFLTGSFHLKTYASPGSKLDRLFADAGYKPRQKTPITYLNLGTKLPLERFHFVYGDFDTF